MNVKGKISKINSTKNRAEVILVEYDNTVTVELPFYKSYSDYVVGQFVVIAVFNDDFNDSIIM